MCLRTCAGSSFPSSLGVHAEGSGYLAVRYSSILGFSFLHLPAVCIVRRRNEGAMNSE
jgi:hypothetical protein